MMALDETGGKKIAPQEAAPEHTLAPTEKPHTLMTRFRAGLRAVVEVFHPDNGAFSEELGGFYRINRVNIPKDAKIIVNGEPGWVIVRRVDTDSTKIQVMKERPGAGNIKLRNVTEEDIVRENPELFQ